MLVVCGQTPLVSAGILVAASYSTDHEVQLQLLDGQTRIVLHHRSTSLHHHNHTALTQALLIFTDSSDKTDQDHVLQTGSASHASLQAAGKRSAPIEVATLVPAVSAVTYLSFLLGETLAARPPPCGNADASAGTLCCLRTIVMLV
jgi:hypothetical protein